MGVVSGLVMAYQFGTNWSGFSQFAGSITGPLLTYEVLTAFFLEAGFLGVMLFGRNKVGPGLHFFATCMVALGTLISTVWILASNSWMHTPQGYIIENGVVMPQDWLKIVFNPSFPWREVLRVENNYQRRLPVILRKKRERQWGAGMSHNKIAKKLHNLQSSAIRELLKHSKMEGVISLGGGIPDPNLFDREGLQIAMDDVLTHSWKDAFQYGLSEGSPQLRGAICQLMRERAISYDIDDVVVTSGSQQSLDILARALINPGDVVVVERPTYLAALQVLQLAEANLMSVGTDGEGMIVDELEALLTTTSVKAVYIVPTFGNPGGVTLTEPRRKLVSAGMGCTIVAEGTKHLAPPNVTFSTLVDLDLIQEWELVWQKNRCSEVLKKLIKLI